MLLHRTLESHQTLRGVTSLSNLISVPDTNSHKRCPAVFSGFFNSAISASKAAMRFCLSSGVIACGLLQFARQCLVNCPLKRNLLPEVLSDSLAYVVIQILRLHVYLTEREVVVLCNSCPRDLIPAGVLYHHSVNLFVIIHQFGGEFFCF